MSALKLRDYQTECVDAVFNAWADGMKAPAVVLPTGAGKTVVFSALVKDWMGSFAPGSGLGTRVMILAHRDELVDQAMAKLRAVLPESVSVGKVKAKDRQTAADVMVCSVQTLGTQSGSALREVKDWESDVGEIGLIITDECHHAAAASYRKVYDAFPAALRLGVTATLARGDGRGLGDVWDDVVYKKSVLWMMARKYLTEVRAQRVELEDLDMAGVKSSRGDWQSGDLGRALTEAHADTAIARAYTEYAKDRQGIVFTPTVETAHAASEALNAAGVRTAVIHGATPRDERLGLFADYRSGKLQVLANCMVLTEGFDMPQAEVAVIARPTQSQPLYVQMVGRVLRPWPGKTEALVLDIVGASATNRLRTLIDLEPDHVRDLRAGETLLDASKRNEEEDQAREQAAVERMFRKPSAFRMEIFDAEMFGGSDYAWGETPKGVMFISCGEVYVFLWPNPDQPGLWDVCMTRQHAKWERTEHVGLDLSMAMAWGEAVAEDNYSGFSVAKRASWRTGKPSQAQMSYAEVLGIDAANMGKGELSDQINQVLAANIFDRWVKG